MPYHELKTYPLTYDFLKEVKGNSYRDDDAFYNHKITVTGQFARVTRHKTMQRLSGVKQSRNKSLPRDKTAYFQKIIQDHADVYVEYLFAKHLKILQNKNRAVTRCVDLARTNHKRGATKTQKGTSFLMFSFANEPSTRKQAWRMYQNAIKNFYHVNGYYPKSLVTLERGEENGRLHFHVIFFDVLRYSYEWWQENVWTYGWVGRTDIYDIQGVAKYITKTALYIVKNNDYVKYQRSYSSSRGLEQPKELYHVADQIPYIVSLVKAKYGYITNGKTYERPNKIDSCQYFLLTPI